MAWLRKRLRNPWWLALVALLIGALLLLAYLYTPLPAARPRVEMRVLEMGWNTPWLQAMPRHITAAQATPFDGIIFDAASDRDDRGLSWVLFSHERIPQAEFDAIAAAVQGIQWGQLTDNFLRLNVYPADLDWFEDWTPILANAEAWAQLAHDLGFTGILLDTELYPPHVHFFDPDAAERNPQYNPDAYRSQAFRRGQKLMQALNRGYPGLTIIYTFGLSAALHWQPEYALFTPFMEGMLDAADEGTTLVDGFESTYFSSQAVEFILAYEAMMGATPRLLVRDPDRYRQQTQAGFGLWIDHHCQEVGGLLAEGCPGGFTPQVFAQAVQHALRYSARYVWVYSERINWYTGQGIPPEWLAAVESFRQ